MKKSRNFLYTWLGLAAIYVLINFLAPANKSQVAKYHLSSLAIHWIDVTVIIPVVIILYLAYVGFINLREYYLSIKDNADGQAFKYFSYGVAVFAYGTLITSIISTAVKWIAIDYPSFTANSVRISNYLSLAIPLLAFWFTSEGGKRLIDVGKIKYAKLKIRFIEVFIVLLGTSYSFVTFHQNNTLSNVTSGPNTYYMPQWIILFTIVLPYVFAWSMGILSVMQVISYRRRIKGLLYKNALNLVAIGIGIVLSSYVVIEYITSLSSKLDVVHLGWILVIVYCLLLMLGVGYLSVAIGSKRLKRIEEV